MGKQCIEISDEIRQDIFNAFTGLGDLAKQREFLVRHVKVLPKKRSTTINSDSRRKNSRLYVLTANNNQIMVCKKFFFNTLSIPERAFRAAFSKITATGTIEKKMRGGRQRSVAIKNKKRENRKEIEAHIDRYPRVRTRIQKNTNIPSFTTYRRIFKAKNLSFLRPKKDQCSLCLSFREGGVSIKEDLKDKYEKHILEKQLVRQKKSESKEKAKTNSDILCAVFDLQQVIYLPISKESAIFYKSRMSVFNFTFYNVATRECYCFVWDETNGKRGSTEIATCLFKAIGQYVGKGVHTIELFCDGCYGQNKNSVVASILLYSLAKYNTIKDISLKFFETNHVQNEGDSAHSAIGYALAHSGDLFVPSQLYPVIRGARTQPKPHSPQRVAVLDQIVGRKMPRSVPTRWNFQIRSVNVVHEYRDSIIECMEQLEEEANVLTYKQASGIRRMLQDPNFCFWLTFFHHIMPHVDILFNQLQKRIMDPTAAQTVTATFEQNINVIRNKIDSIVEEASNFEIAPTVAKRKRPNENKSDHRIACLEVCDVIISNEKERFAFTGHLVAASLLISEKFVEYHNKFPDQELDLTCTSYKVLNKIRLKTELSVIYSNCECRDLRGAVPLLKIIISNNLEETMGETKKLLQILVTTPMTTAEAERSFSTLKRIKTFLRNSMCKDRLTALSMLSIEKKCIASIQNFNEKIEYKLECIMAGQTGTHNICVCKMHQNVSLKIHGIQRELQKYKITFNTSMGDFIKQSVCELPKPGCFLYDCEECPGTAAIMKKVEEILTENNVTQVTFSQWINTDRCDIVQISEKTEKFLEALGNDLSLVLKHKEPISLKRKVQSVI
ncbi:unnamed protein product [Brassicogethes aeneus]|uniref:HAT C-terminal dimerisation domain-containing protein n=1 Tax=Brassicogethes aeneus TaxID=1431903 RepID=A0A9P0AU83_BRAAE|nr:unnamed protein product [Brassicogethes aeneus]